MHYGHYKQRDIKALKALIESFPFATIAANAPDGPINAHAPLTFRQEAAGNGAVEFHLANENPIIPHLQNGVNITITVNGPGAHVSPNWYSASFPGDKPDRSKTAPTYNYIIADLRGPVKIMNMDGLTKQIRDLVAANEPVNGWRIQEIDPAIFEKWRNLITGFRVPIESFDMTAKLSQKQNPADKPGIIAGLKQRGALSDLAMAQIMEIYDGTPESLIKALHIVSIQYPTK